MACSGCGGSVAFGCQVYVTDVSPDSGVSGGDTVTITGAGFTATEQMGVDRVLVGGQDAVFEVVDDHTITVTVPDGVDPAVAADVVVVKGQCRVSVPGGINGGGAPPVAAPTILLPEDGSTFPAGEAVRFSGTAEPGASLIVQAWDGAEWVFAAGTFVAEADGTWSFLVPQATLLPGTNPYSVWDETHSLRSNQISLTVETAPAAPVHPVQQGEVVDLVPGEVDELDG